MQNSRQCQKPETLSSVVIVQRFQAEIEAVNSDINNIVWIFSRQIKRWNKEINGSLYTNIKHGYQLTHIICYWTSLKKYKAKSREKAMK